MNTRGSLELFPLADFLQVLADLDKSGKLTLSRYEERGLLILQHGKIIHAASSSIRETLGGLLVGQELISEQELVEALAQQADSGHKQRLGTILVHAGILSRQDLERIVLEQTRRIVRELLEWRHGFFEFEPLKPDFEREITKEASELVLHDGLSTTSVIPEPTADLTSPEPEEVVAEPEPTPRPVETTEAVEIPAAEAVEEPPADEILEIAATETVEEPPADEVLEIAATETVEESLTPEDLQSSPAEAVGASSTDALEDAQTEAEDESSTDEVLAASVAQIVEEWAADEVIEIPVAETFEHWSAHEDLEGAAPIEVGAVDAPVAEDLDSPAATTVEPGPSQPPEQERSGSVPSSGPADLGSSVERQLASLAALSTPAAKSSPHEAARPDQPEVSRPPAETVEEPARGTQTESLTQLRDLLIEIRSPEFTGELSTKIMDYASELFSRSVLFSIQGTYFCGMGSYGIGLDAGSSEAIRQMRIPVADPSILADVAALHDAYQGPLPSAEWNRKLIELLGDEEPDEVVAVPLVVESRVVMVLYGDTLQDAEPVESTAALELLMHQVGLAMEKNLLKTGLAEERSPASRRSGLPSEDLRSLVDADPEPALVVDVDGRILYANRAMGASALSTVAELLGSDVGSLVHPDDESDLREILRELGHGGTPGGYSVRFRKPDGSWLGAYLLPSTIRGQSGELCIMLRAATAGSGAQRHDPLTGLLHREAIVERVGKTLQRSKHEEGAIFGVLVLEINRFKLVNAGFGWATGNELLRAVANRLAEHLRPSDVVGRLGGDQFCVLLDRLRGRDDAKLVASRIIEFLGRPFHIDGHEISISISIGGALSYPDHEEADEVIADAEAAVQEAKTKQGSTFWVRDEEPRSRSAAVARLQLENDLRRGIEFDEFRPFFQPILSLETGAISVLELLVRWEHPERGLLQPADFLSVAEETGLIVPIAKNLLRDGCLQLRRWQDRFAPDPPLAIAMNFTASHLEQSEVMNTVQASMSRSGVEGRQLVVEITESMMIQETDDVVQILSVLKELDVRIFLDDFGVEYSSLSYLHRLPVNAIKVDRSFVGRLHEDRGSEVIVRAIVDLAHSLEKTVVAEGIETIEQFHTMRDLGCELGQGFLFGHPESAERTEQLLSSEPPWQELFSSAGQVAIKQPEE